MQTDRRPNICICMHILLYALTNMYKTWIWQFASTANWAIDSEKIQDLGQWLEKTVRNLTLDRFFGDSTCTPSNYRPFTTKIQKSFSGFPKLSLLPLSSRSCVTVGSRSAMMKSSGSPRITSWSWWKEDTKQLESYHEVTNPCLVPTVSSSLWGCQCFFFLK